MILLLVDSLYGFQFGYPYRPLPYERMTNEKCNPKSLIQFITDGTGPTTYTMARDYSKLFGKDTLFSDEFVVGLLKTHSANSLVTDSAAGATALASQTKTNNGYVGVDPNGVPLPTILEAAKLEGMTTGIVVTSTITHATPGGYYAHVLDRGWEDIIANQLVHGTEFGNTVDLIMGGGLEFFTPNTTQGSRRLDNQNLLTQAYKSGYKTVINNTNDFFTTEFKLPVLAPLVMGHMPFELDRKNSTPSLLQMVQKALPLLYKSGQDSCKGFFMMIEASRIDHAGHNNDAASHVHDMLIYQKVLEYVYHFSINKNILVVSTSDHETGGFTLANGDHAPYRYFPHVLGQVKKSTEKAAIEFLTQNSQSDLKSYIKTWFDIDVTLVELDLVNKAYVESKLQSSFYPLMRYFSKIINERAEIGATTHGHTAVDVPLITFGPDIGLHGIMENTIYSKKLWDHYSFDFPGLKEKLKHQSVKDPFGRIPIPEKRHCTE